MTRLLIFLGIFNCFIITSVSGQISFGLNGGLNLTTFSNESSEDDVWDTGIGYRIGGFSEKAFGKIGLHAEVDYSFFQAKGLFDDKISLNYISIPITFFYKPIKQLKILAGPEINFLIAQSGPKYSRSFGKETFENFDYGVHLQIELLLIKRLGVYIRNYFGLQYNEKMSVFQSQKTIGLNKLNIIGVGFNYYLTNKDN